MRALSLAILSLLILAITAATATSPAKAQTYDPNYPVCLHVYGRLTYYECNFTSLPQCQMSASGRSAQCEVNPYYARASVAPARRHKRQRAD